VSEHHGELIPAYAADNVCLARLADQRFADRPQHGVAGRVAVRVVNLLEVVEIEIDEAGLDLVPLHQGNDSGGFPHEGAAVVDWRQRIVVGGGFSLGQRQFQLLDIEPERIDLADQDIEGGAHLGRQVAFRHGKEARHPQGGINRPLRRGDGFLLAPSGKNGEEFHWPPTSHTISTDTR
jgi:hypothetical protein